MSRSQGIASKRAWEIDRPHRSHWEFWTFIPSIEERIEELLTGWDIVKISLARIILVNFQGVHLKEWEWEGEAGPVVHWEVVAALTGLVVLLEREVDCSHCCLEVKSTSFEVQSLKDWKMFLLTRKIEWHWEYENNWIYYVETQLLLLLLLSHYSHVWLCVTP